MKKTILTLCLLVLMAGITKSFAQQSEVVMKKKQHVKLSPAERAKKKTDQMTKSLALDKNLAETIYQLNLKYAKEQDALRAEKLALKKKAVTEKTKHHAKVSTVLSEEQNAKLEEIIAKRKEKRVPKPPKPPIPANIDQ
ncbi:MAG: hypothetical protein AB8B74_01850 [Crocinitomicaceae bacterium]